MVVANIQPAVVEVPKKKGKGVPKKSKKVEVEPVVEVQPPVEVAVEKIPESLSPETPEIPAPISPDLEECWEDECRKIAGTLGGWEGLFRKYKEMEAKLAEKPRKKSVEDGRLAYKMNGKTVRVMPLYWGKKQNFDGALPIGTRVYGRVVAEKRGKKEDLIDLGTLESDKVIRGLNGERILWNNKDGGSVQLEINDSLVKCWVMWNLA